MISKIKNEYQTLEKEPDYNTLYINKCIENNQVPNSMGILRHTNSKFTLSGLIGKAGIKPMTESLLFMPDQDYPNEIDVEDNHLKDEDIYPLIDALRKKVTRLNLKDNKLSSKGVLYLGQMIYNEPLFNLKSLNLSGLKINDSVGYKFIGFMEAADRLEELNLNNNLLENKTANKLAEYLVETSITRLELHNNYFKGDDLIQLFTDLNKYSNIQFIDLSWNKIGYSDTAVKILSESLADNKSIYHLDLSQNGIKDTNQEVFFNNLRKNQTLIGLHLNGNGICLDLDGNICSYTNKKESLVEFQLENTQRSIDLVNFNKFNISGNWIGERWLPYTIKCTGSPLDEINDSKKVIFDSKLYDNAVQKVSSSFKNKFMQDIKLEDPVFVHFEFDKYRSWNLSKSTSYESTFMIPPGRWRMFFTTQMNHFMLSSLYEKEKIPHPVKYTLLYDKNKPEITTHTILVLGYNIITVDPELIPPIDYSKCPILPRSREIWEYSESLINWSFPISIWAKWVKNEEELGIKCFDNDWEYSKERLPKALRDDEKDRNMVKKRVRPLYYLIRFLYKYYSSFNLVAGIYCIGETNFNTIFHDLNYYDTYFTPEMPPIIFRETVTSDKNPFKELSPPNGCVRHQFMAFMIKVAGRKFKIEPKINITFDEAVEKFFDENQEKLKLYDPNTWRWEKYYNEKCDLFFKKMMIPMEKAFEKYMLLYGTKPGEKPYLDLEIFNRFIKEMMLESYVNMEKNGCYFNMSLTVQTNELINDSNTKMRNKLEFFEAFARLADECKFVGELENVIYPTQPYNELELGDKLWCLAPNMIKNVFEPKSKADKLIVEDIKSIINKSGVVKIN